MGEIDGAFRSWGISKGGTGQVSLACARAAQNFGAEVRTESPVQKILVENGRATGVVLENGDELEGKIVISNCDPHRTFVKFGGRGTLGARICPADQPLQISR